MYSGLAAYSSGVKHHGNIAWMNVSETLDSALAAVCQLSSTVFMYRSVLGQQLCTDSDFTFAGYFAANHNPTAPPRDSPETCALSIPMDCMKAATSSASVSVEYSPAGSSESPVPLRSTLMQVKCEA